MSALIIRPAVPADAPQINTIIHSAFRLYADEIRQIRVKALEEPDDAVLRDIAEHYVAVAEENGVLLGSLRIKQIGEKLAYLYRFGVDPGLRGTGVGSKLIQAAIDYCTEKGYDAIALHTNSKYYKLARYYYGKQFYVHSTSTEKGYLRALFIKELTGNPVDLTPAFNE